MNRRNFIITTGAVLMVAMLATGYAAVAAEYGSADDPLITRSYLDQVLTPKVQTKIDSSVSAQRALFQNLVDSKIENFSALIDRKIGQLASDEDFIREVADAAGGSFGSSDGWQAVELGQGQQLLLAAGSEAVLESGAAACVASGGAGLTNLSATAKLANGGALAVGSLYQATTEDAGLIAQGNARVLVSGDYRLA